MNLYDKLNKEKKMLEKLLQRREELNKKIQQANDKIKIIEEDIENLEMKTTVKVIKSRGYSIHDVREALSSGVFDDVLKKE